jgi:6-pyruvoyltetrahydropterin/6-carboxytetrahydropterin synthase
MTYNSGMPSFLTRRVTFAAAHRYRRPDWSEEQNARVFGLCARESYHGHSYVCDVTVTGAIDPTTGMIVDLAALDRALATEVRERFDHRNINLDVPEFADGKLVPTGEELSRFICERVQRAIGASARVVEVILAEDATLRSSYRPD